MNNKTITVSHKSVRVVPNLNKFKMKLEYTTSKGKFRSVVHFTDTREEGKSELNFRVAGLKNSGCEVVMGKRPS